MRTIDKEHINGADFGITLDGIDSTGVTVTGEIYGSGEELDITAKYLKDSKELIVKFIGRNGGNVMEKCTIQLNENIASSIITLLQTTLEDANRPESTKK